MDGASSTDKSVDDAEKKELAEFFNKRSDLYMRMTEDPRGQSVIDWYNQEATLYDNQFENVSFVYPREMANTINGLIKDKNARILDIAAGTGKVGSLLRDYGFNNLDAIDGSEKMLTIAKERGIYNNYIHCLVGNEKIPLVEDASYNGVCCGGSVARGHLNYDSLQTMLRTIIPGGHLVFTVAYWNFQFDDFSRKRLESCFKDLKQRGIFTLKEERETFHRQSEPALMFILQR